MATQGQQHQGEMDDPFASLSHYEFALLTTFRTSGVGVPTAMWFAHEHGKLYMVTDRSTGKLKRIRTTRRVLVAPCDWMGNLLGPQIEGYARAARCSACPCQRRPSPEIRGAIRDGFLRSG